LETLLGKQKPFQTFQEAYEALSSASTHNYPLVIGHTGRPRKGRGFSLGELREAGISLDKAKRLGLYIDKRRDTVHQENVEALKDLVELLEKGEIPPQVKSKPSERQRFGSPAKGRAFRGLTAAGKKSRGLYKVEYRRHPQHKWD